MNPDLFRADLEAKPAALRALADRLDESDPWRGLGPIRRVVMLGMGSSRYAAQVAARRLRAAGIDAIAEYASVRDWDRSATTIAISATGGSVETLDAIEGVEFVALTNDPASELAQRAATVVPMHAGVEAGGVACRTFQHTQLLLHALVERLTDGSAGVTGGSARVTADLARRTAEATEDLLERRDEWLPACRDLLDGGDGVFPIAPAERLSSALQSALMFREGPRRPADGCETGDWAHVDVYLTKTLRYRALFLPGSRYDEQALEWLRARGSTIVAVGADVPGAAATVRFRHDEDLGVRLMTETLIAELVAAAWWV
jgi:glucosamine--fructose-6-phosphate aminotransferase (isomerizing)